MTVAEYIQPPFGQYQKIVFTLGFIMFRKSNIIFLFLLCICVAAEVIFIPGWQSKEENIPEYQEWLTKIFPNDQTAVITWDAAHRWSQAKLNAEANVLELAAAIKAKSVKERQNITLIGHSLGGYICCKIGQELAQDNIKIKEFILLGAAIGSADTAVEKFCAAADQITNVFSRDDNVLRFMFSNAERNYAIGFTGIPPSKAKNGNISQYTFSARPMLTINDDSSILEKVSRHSATLYLQELQKIKSGKNKKFIALVDHSLIEFPRTMISLPPNMVIPDVFTIETIEEYHDWVLGSIICKVNRKNRQGEIREYKKKVYLIIDPYGAWRAWNLLERPLAKTFQVRVKNAINSQLNIKLENAQKEDDGIDDISKFLLEHFSQHKEIFTRICNDLAMIGIDGNEIYQQAKTQPRSMLVPVPEHMRLRPIVINQEQEKHLTGLFVEHLRKDGKLYSDAKQEALVRKIAQKICAVLPEEIPINIYLVKDDSLNAACLPDGSIVINSGTFEELDNNEALLAAIIAHEYGHAIARHGAESFTQSLMQRLGNEYVGEFSKKLQGDFKWVKGAALAISYRFGFWMGFRLPYSRTMEHEADRLAAIYMQKAGYDPQKIIDVFEFFLKDESEDLKWLQYLSTHPLTQDRINAVQLHLEAMITEDEEVE